MVVRVGVQKRLSMAKMTFEELLAKANAETTRAKPSHEESQLQRICVKWFRLQYPELAVLLFAVPNGGQETSAKRDNESRGSNCRSCGYNTTNTVRRLRFALHRVQNRKRTAAGNAKAMATGGGTCR